MSFSKAAKLSAQSVKNCRALYWSGRKSIKDMAAFYHVNYETMRKAVTGETWAWLSMPEGEPQKELSPSQPATTTDPEMVPVREEAPERVLSDKEIEESARRILDIQRLADGVPIKFIPEIGDAAKERLERIYHPEESETEVPNAPKESDPPDPFEE